MTGAGAMTLSVTGMPAGRHRDRCLALRLVLRSLERQRHAAQVAAGLHQDQWAFVKLHCWWPLARYMHGLGFGGDGGLHLADFLGVRVHPLQTAALRHLHQVL